MSLWTSTLSTLTVLTQSELGRVLATLATGSISLLSLKYVQRRSQQIASTTDLARRRSNLVAARNIILVITLFLIGAIWASKIAGAALSLAAVAGAILIVSKEFLTNLLGTGMLAVSKPYRVGDFIEMAHVTGRVVDTDLLSTTLVETLEGHQLTGRTVSLPNSILLTQPTRNLTATGLYMINMLPVAITMDGEVFARRDALLHAANAVCGRWVSDANLHLEKMESRDLVDLPSAAPKVLFDLSDPKAQQMALRYACRPNERVKVEQEILDLYLKTLVAKKLVGHAAKNNADA